jgi:hypothetical protein
VQNEQQLIGNYREQEIKKKVWWRASNSMPSAGLPNLIKILRAFLELNMRTNGHTRSVLQLGDDELASGDWREGEVLFPL